MIADTLLSSCLDQIIQITPSQASLAPHSPTSTLQAVLEQIRSICSLQSDAGSCKGLQDDSHIKQISALQSSPNSSSYAQKINQNVRALPLHNFVERVRLGEGINIDYVKAAFYYRKTVDLDYPPSIL